MGGKAAMQVAGGRGLYLANKTLAKLKVSPVYFFPEAAALSQLARIQSAVSTTLFCCSFFARSLFAVLGAGFCLFRHARCVLA